MKYVKTSFILSAALCVLPIVNAFGQEVKQPGTFDPKTTSAHEGVPAVEAAAAMPELQVALAPKPAGKVIVPASSVSRPEDIGLRAHTHTRVFVPAGHGPLAEGPDMAVANDLKSAASASPNTTFNENPGSLACVLGLISYSGCTYSGGFSLHPTGGQGVIVVVDAYDNPDAASDLTTFDAEWSMPAANFTQIYCQPYNSGTGTCSTTTTPPAVDTGWALEESLDIEYAHSMAPSAKIFLVEAASNSYADLTWAEAWAGYYADINGGGEVTNSWGGSEFSGETAYDGDFNNFNGSYFPVVYLASGGDSGTIEYPSASPYVISAGGTTINRDANGNYVSQTCWSGTGRGTSAYEGMPYPEGYMGGVAGKYRQTNDISSDADPNSGVWVYSGENGGWLVVGGTSVAAPTLAGVINLSGNIYHNTLKNQMLLYSEYAGKNTFPTELYDVSPAFWDQCTGIGTPKGKLGK